MAATVPQPAVREIYDHLLAPPSDVLLVSVDLALAETIVQGITLGAPLSVARMKLPDKLNLSDFAPGSTVIYLPSPRGNAPMLPDLVEAEAVCSLIGGHPLDMFLLVSSGAVYGASFRNPGLMDESSPLPKGKQGSAREWLKLERIAQRFWDLNDNLAVLRCATVLSKGCANSLARQFSDRIALTAAGHDPSIQLLSPTDLARAIARILQTRTRGIFNVAPKDPIPLKEALRRTGVRHLAIPRTLLRSAYAIRRREFPDQLNYKRYSWTISNRNLAKIGFRPEKSSLETLLEFRDGPSGKAGNAPDKKLTEFDDFGMDKQYILAYGRTLFRFLSDYYWRIEYRGLEHVPPEGRGVLVGMHRGFMPFDGVMALHLLVQRTGRYPRFLVHPSLLKFPFLSNFMTKLGGVMASQQNADRILEEGELVGIFPEGIQGAFTPYRQAYQLQEFGRDAFVKVALRNRAPIIPFVTVGSAEIFPILGKIQWRRWTQYTEWPSFPLTPTFPLLPVPLPSKWHTQFLPPIHIENEYPPEAEENRAVVKAISIEVRSRMQQAVNEMLSRRRSIFFGSIFEPEADR
jgi:1-acyl-sn-glycerol-3-phosphate acyltransferase